MLLCTGKLFSQSNTYDYNFSDYFEASDVSLPNTLSLNCSQTSIEFNNYYGRYDFYLNNYNKLPILTIPININIWQDNNAGNNWGNSSSTINRFYSIIAQVNSFYSNNCQPQYYGVYDPSITQFLSNTKIRFEIQGIYFYTNSTLNITTDSGVLTDYLQNNHPERLNQLNIHITRQDPNSGVIAGYSNGPSSTPLIVTYNKHSNPLNPGIGGDYAFSQHLAHELGHNLSLLHTYDGNNNGLYGPGDACCPETNVISNPDFLDDIFGFNPPNWCGAVNGQVCYHKHQWSCNPSCIPGSSNNMMGGTQNACYFSPKQIAKMYRALCLLPIRKIVKCENYGNNLPKIEVANNESWDFDIWLYNDLVVKAGNTLTIKCKVAFPPGYRLIVEPTAKLILDGGVLTSHGDCNMWQGIMLHGNINQSQQIINGMPVYQGMVEMKNGAIIENAVNGISTMRRDANGNIDWSSFGGIIRASNSSFLNNKRDVEFMSYPNYNNISFFNNCLFEVNQILKDGPLVKPETRVSMWNIKNVNFRGCTFKYSAGNVYGLNEHGYGIYSIDAKYNVSNYCSSTFFPCPSTSIVNSRFENLEYGIYATSSNPLFNANVTNAKFINNIAGGAFYGGMHYPIFSGCHVDVGSPQKSFGLYLQSCKYYKIQNNDFLNSQGYFDCIGIYSTSSGNGAHEIYRNTFSNLKIGIAPQENNSGLTNNDDGLKMNCNTFSFNEYDVAMMGNTPTVAYTQGAQPLPQFLVRNFYGASCGNENQWFISNSYKAVMHASNAEPQTRPLPQPDCSDLYVNVIPTSISYQPSHCPSTFGSSISDIKSQISQLKNTIEILKENYKQQLDGGNTQNLLNFVNSNMSLGNLKNMLLNYSPYLSDDVLLAYLNKAQIPNGHVKELVIANSPVTIEVKNLIDSKNLPNGIKQEIDDAQKGISPRHIAELNISVHEFQLQSLISEEITYYLNDTLNANSIDSAIAIIKNERREHAACELVRAYMYKGDYLKATEIIDTLETKPEFNDFCQFQKLLLELNTSVEKCYVIIDDPSKRQSLEADALDESKEHACHAQAILKQVLEYKYEELKLLPDLQSLRIAAFNTGELVDDIAQDKNFGISIYPNPTNNGFVVNYKNENDKNITIKIIDVTGKLIDSFELSVNSEKFYETSKLNNSIYFALFYIDNEMVKQEKVLISK
ncbi:MAG: hypothetical protein KatS3mg027_2622 [Bacteroidia bacterium]|nr:MAG: hypothetical protein KatS3mg027_2622 [Bacteroidia bacterium]